MRRIFSWFKKRGTRIEISLVVVGILIVTLSISRPNITGFVSSEIYAQKFDMQIEQSRVFTLQNINDIPMHISSLSISGIIKGNGTASVYLVGKDNTRYLVYTNADKKKKMFSAITGYAIGAGTATREKKTNILQIIPGPELNSFEPLKKNYETQRGEFSKQCAASCILPTEKFNMPSYYLLFYIQPGTTMNLKEIIFTLVKE